MARAPILQLNDIRLSFGGKPVLDGLDLVVQTGDRIALVGRNGSGKSSLQKVMAGLLEPDHGMRVVPSGVSVGYMAQDPEMGGFSTLGDFAAQGLEPGETYRIERAATGLMFDLEMPVATASGGERRRAALARLMAHAPQLMLLDEPTNHLDIAAIGWLEGQLMATRAAFVLISHDRALLRALTRATLWIDRGVVRRQEKGFDSFEAWRDKTWADEDISRHKLNRKIKADARWAVEGISARRRRNQGRLRALADLRAERGAQVRRQGTAGMVLETGTRAGKRVIEARDISHRFDGQDILRGFSIRVARGDRVAFVGPNGVGKTTLINILTGQLTPDAGDVRLGTNLDMAVFDQNCSGLAGDMSLWENLVGDASTRVSGKADQIMVRGRPRHVVGYLKDFLFDETQARAPVHSLSGGEKSRLLLARLMARNSNLLVLDEPTNDLDVETLDLLQELLADYDGTVLMVSHDRDFIDRVATITVAMEGNGQAVVYAGGWSDYQAQRGADDVVHSPRHNIAKAAEIIDSMQKKAIEALSFTERHRLSELPAVIAQLEAEIVKLTAYLSDPERFGREPVGFRKASAALADRQTALAAAEDEWVHLEDKSSA